MKKALIAAFAALASVCTAAAHAGALVDLAVVSRATGERIPVHAHRGRLYVAGAPGAKYSVLLDNKTGERVLAVVSVDGVIGVAVFREYRPPRVSLGPPVLHSGPGARSDEARGSASGAARDSAAEPAAPSAESSAPATASARRRQRAGRISGARARARPK